MVRESEIREGELAVDMPAATRCRAWSSSAASARPGPRGWRRRGRAGMTARCAGSRFSSHGCRRCKGVDLYSNLEVIYWLHLSRRDLVLQSPKNNKATRGTFSLRSPVRPNPIGTSIVKLVGIEGIDGAGARPRLPRRDAADRSETRPLRIHAAGAAASRAISRRSEVCLGHREPAVREATDPDEVDPGSAAHRKTLRPQ